MEKYVETIILKLILYVQVLKQIHFKATALVSATFHCL